MLLYLLIILSTLPRQILECLVPCSFISKIILVVKHFWLHPVNCSTFIRVILINARHQSTSIKYIITTKLGPFFFISGSGVERAERWRKLGDTTCCRQQCILRNCWWSLLNVDIVVRGHCWNVLSPKVYLPKEYGLILFMKTL